LPPPRIVLVEDDQAIAETLRRTLEEIDWGAGKAMVLATSSAREFMAAFGAHDPDIVFIDLRLSPPYDSSEEGKELIDWVADGNSHSGVIVFTDVPEVVDGSDALSRGADDYIVKPARPATVVERTRAVWRRVHLIRSRLSDLQSTIEPTFQLGHWRFRPSGRTIHGVDGAELRLTISEYQLLDHLIKAERHLITPATFNVFVLERDPDTVDRRLDNIVYRLRRKLGETFPIQNVGSGSYRLTECSIIR
jgi:DNA-binding response OmpR family regulator